MSARTSNYYHHGGVTKQISPQDDHDSWYYSFVAGGESYTIDVDTNEAADDRLTIFVNYRLEDFSDDLLGVTGVGMEMDGFARFLRSRQEKYDRIIYLVDKNGLVQAHPDLSLIHTWSIRDHASLATVAGRLLTPSLTPVDAEYEDGRDTILVSSRYMPELEWFLVVEQNETRSLRSARANLLRTIFAGFMISVAIIMLYALTMRRFDLRLELLATTDALTGVANRRAFDTRLTEAKSRSERTGIPLSLLMFDIDCLKEINDEYGHVAGDGESGATVSVGIAEYRSAETAESLVGRADRALYASKQAGRNRITVAE